MEASPKAFEIMVKTTYSAPISAAYVRNRICLFFIMKFSFSFVFLPSTGRVGEEGLELTVYLAEKPILIGFLKTYYTGKKEKVKGMVFYYNFNCYYDAVFKLKIKSYIICY